MHFILYAVLESRDLYSSCVPYEYEDVIKMNCYDWRMIFSQNMNIKKYNGDYFWYNKIKFSDLIAFS